MKKAIVLIAALAFSNWVGSASAGSISYSATNAGGPLHYGLYPIDLQPFSVSADGLYDLEITAANFDTYVYLWLGIPLIPGDDASWFAKDDDGGVGVLSLLSDVNLTAGLQYTLGVESFFAGQTGTFTAQIRGVGDIDLGSVPTPATLALFGLGLAGLGWSRRQKV